MSRENVETARRGYQHYSRTGDVLDEIYHPDVVLDMSAFLGWSPQQVYHGIEAMMAFLADWQETWDNWELEVEELHDAGDKVVAVLSQGGRSKESGVPVDMKFANVIAFRDGKQFRVEMYASPDEALEAAGLEE